ncbi:hypothetical protein FOPG_17234 [Fusarium oxysporum f. sp. conglutinans race 2 54008]|uniref:Uncharacterized protein n=1 Tax=Fusarium oxysporum f. sp. conglutinans race 2 54008 TaxID=1089457 RepID=X0GSJ4_FUSOX|nr:hypothetical protein FOPG_17234 [Fusarium oxysporum f. sp. conglutinans race 2 54008]
MSTEILAGMTDRAWTLLGRMRLTIPALPGLSRPQPNPSGKGMPSAF